MILVLRIYNFLKIFIKEELYKIKLKSIGKYCAKFPKFVTMSKLNVKIALNIFCGNFHNVLFLIELSILKIIWELSAPFEIITR